MKTKRSFLLIFTLCAALSLTACNGKQPANTEKPQDTQTESSTASSDDSSSELDDLYQQENQLFADHKDVWDKVFGMMSKSTADINHPVQNWNHQKKLYWILSGYPAVFLC